MKFLVLAFISFFCFGAVFARAGDEQTHDLINELHKGPILGIEILVAGASFNSPASMYGHSSLRFIRNLDNPFDDIVVSFVAKDADVDEAKMNKLGRSSFFDRLKSFGATSRYLWKGVSGGWSIGVKTNLLKDVLEQYAGNEGRSLSRIIIPTTPQMRTRILNYVLQFNSDSFNAKYYFHSFNCAIAIVKVLQAAGLPPFPLQTNSPLSLEDATRRYLWSPYPAVNMIDVPTITEEIYKSMNLPDKQKPNDTQVLAAVRKLDSLSLIRLYLLRSHLLPTSVVNILVADIKARGQNFSLDEIFGTQIFKESAYDLSQASQADTLNQYFAKEKNSFCPKLESAIRYRQMYPIVEKALPAFQIFKSNFQNFCSQREFRQGR